MMDLSEEVKVRGLPKNPFQVLWVMDAVEKRENSSTPGECKTVKLILDLSKWGLSPSGTSMV